MAVKRLLTDPEWSAWSDYEVAEQCSVSQPFVLKLRKEFTNNVISENPRKYITKHGTESVMATGNIGKSRPKPAHGLACDEETYNRLVAQARTPAEIAANAEPVAKRGAPEGNQNAAMGGEGIKPDSIRIDSGVPKYGTDPTYLAGRIKRKAIDGDEVAAKVVVDIEAGKYATMAEAARAAGILKPPSPVKVAVRQHHLPSCCILRNGGPRQALRRDRAVPRSRPLGGR